VKLIYCNGTILEVRDAGPVVFRLRAGKIPIKVNGYQLLEEGPARDLLRDLLATGWYEGGRVEPA
jgi:hypothetical protein